MPPKIIPPLTDIAVKNLKAKAKVFRKFDGQGLYVEVTPKGKKYWRLKYRFGGKEKRISFGTYPNVSIKEARIKASEARALLEKDIDPSAERKAKQQREVELNEQSFAAIAHEWHVKKYSNKDPGYAKRVWRMLEKDIFPHFGHLPIGMIPAKQVRDAIQKIDNRGAHESAHRALQVCYRIFAYGHAQGLCSPLLKEGIRETLTQHTPGHFAAILDPEGIGKLLRAIDGYEQPLTRYAMQIGMYTFVRPGELRKFEWDEINWDKKEWKLLPEKMKLRKPHIVPLSRQVLAVLEELQPMTSYSKYVFPGRDRHQPMSEATVNAALRRMGYSKDQMTGHGFRKIASTLLNEEGTWNADAIERQLAHTDRSKVRATYDHSKHLPERRKMMQAYAELLDELKKSGEVISFFKHQAS